MIAIWIGIFFFIQVVVLIFVISMGKSAALADRDFERSQAAVQRPWTTTPELNDGNKELGVSPDTKPTNRFTHSSAHS